MINYRITQGGTILAALFLCLTVSCKKDDTQTEIKDSRKELISFRIDSTSAQIDQTSHTVTIQVPYATDLAHAKPVITVSAKAVVSPASGAEVNMSAPVSYKVTAEDGSVQSYTVTATKGQNTEARILEFKVEARAMSGFFYAGTIDENTHTIIVGAPLSSIDRTKLPVVIKVSDGATVTPTGTDVIDFTLPVVFKVKAQSGAEQEYTVKVLNNETSAFIQIPLISSVGDGSYRSAISVLKTQVYGVYPDDTAGISTPLFMLFAVLETEDVSNMRLNVVRLPEGATLSPAPDVPQNFNHDVIYTITAQSGEKKQCTIRFRKRKILLINDMSPIISNGINSPYIGIPFICNKDIQQVWLMDLSSNITYNCTVTSATRGADGSGRLDFSTDVAALPKDTKLNLKVKFTDGTEVVTRCLFSLL